MVAMVDKFAEPYLRLVEAVDDAIAGEPTLDGALFKALEAGLYETGRTGGAIYITRPDLNLPRRLIANNPGLTWQDQILDTDSVLMKEIERVVNSGGSTQPNEELDLAATFLLSFKTEQQGVLLLCGDPLSNEEFRLWETIGRSISRATYSHSIRKADLQNGISSLMRLASSLNVYTDYTDTQLWILSGIKELLQGEAAALLVLDDDGTNVVIKKTIKEKSEWINREVIQFDKSLARNCLRQEKLVYIENAVSDPDFTPTIDAIDGIPTRSILCAPLISVKQTLGIIEIINPAATLKDKNDVSQLGSLVKMLSEAIFTMLLIQKLRIINADLEASRWELLHSRNTLRTLFDSIPSSIYIIDYRYSLIAINKSRAERANNRPNILVGKKCYEALYKRSEPCLNCHVKETLSTGKTTNRNDREWISTDQAIDWEISTFAIQELTDRPDQAIILEEDVTEKRRLESNLLQNEKLTAVGQLAAGMAHEINNPLSAIIANTQLLMRDLPSDNEDVQESLKLIVTAGRRASHVVQNLLGFTHKAQYNYDWIDLNGSIRDSLNLIQHEFVSHSITLTCNLQEDMPKIYANRDHLLSVWINMMMNAIDALINGTRMMVVSTQFTANEFRVVFQDNGQGINPDIVSRIFEPFYTTKSAGRGTGLGLSVCHRIIKEHGGYIQVESQIDLGTKFTIIIPRSEGSQKE